MAVVEEGDVLFHSEALRAGEAGACRQLTQYPQDIVWRVG